MLALLFACAHAPDDEATPGGGDQDTLAAAPAATRLTDDGLTDDARAALGLVPAWLRPDLRLALQQEDAEDQDALAGALLGLDDPWLADEVGFAMAHVGPDVLGKRSVYPEVFVENARMIYEVDPLLDYVELTEHGEPGVDDDWYTTATYKVEVDGVVTDVEIDRDTYYWYVVHPRLEDEHPWFVNAWDTCSSSSLECASTPEEGTFWRRFLWSEAAETCPTEGACPVLMDHLAGVPTLWGAADGNDAVHGVAAFMLSSTDEGRWFDFGAYGERSIQPNRIYALGRGNCGEWADMTTSLSRTALIPAVNVTPASWDHTWDAFWQDRWIQWEPVNWAFDQDAGTWYGSSTYTTWATRGDMSTWFQTSQYDPDVATLEVHVTDAAGSPVDGATVVLWSPYDTSWWYAGELATDTDGVARFEVGAGQEFAYLVDSAVGAWPGDDSIDRATTGIAAGETATVEVTLDGAVPAKPAPEVVAPADGDATLAATVTAEGRVLATSWRFGEAGHRPALTAPVVTWVMDEADYDAFVAGGEFTVAADTLDATLPSDRAWVLVVANVGTVATAAVGRVEGTLTSDAFAGETAIDEDFALLPGEHLAIRLGN